MSMRRALQRASTFHPSVDSCEAIPEEIPAEQRKKAHASVTTSRRRSKKRERRQSKNAIPSSTSTPILPLEQEISSTNYSVLTKSGNPLSRSQISLSDILAKISISWSRPVAQTPVSGDLPRLASRVVIQDYRNGKNEEYSVKETEPTKEMVANIMNRVCDILEEKSTTEKFRNFIETVKDDPGEVQKWTENLLRAAGDNSKTVAICKSINQSMIIPVATQLKVIIFSLINEFTKDVRTSDGWRVFLRFSDEDITCTHVRKEMSIATGPNSFEFEWRLDIKFSNRLDKIEKVDLTLTGLNCHEGMAKEKKQQLIDAMNWIVC